MHSPSRVEPARARGAGTEVRLAIDVPSPAPARVALAAARVPGASVAGLVLVNAAAYPGALPWVGRPGMLPGADRLLGLTPAWCLRLGLVLGSGSRGWTMAAHGHRCRTAFRRAGV